MKPVWSFIFLVAVLGSTLLTATMAAAQPAEAYPQVQLQPAQWHAVAGEAVEWLVQIDPGPKKMEQVSISTASSQLWQPLDALAAIKKVDSMQTVHLRMMPIQTGELPLILMLEYREAGRKMQRMVVGARVVQVEALSTGVSIQITAIDNSTGWNRGQETEVQVTNAGPYLLKGTKFLPHASGNGGDILLGDIAPQETVRITTRLTPYNDPPIVGGYLVYGWTDAAGATHTAESEALTATIPQGVLARIPDTLLAAGVGLVAGVLSAFLTTLVTILVQRRLQSGTNRNRMDALVGRTIVQAEMAAETCTLVQLSYLETIYLEEGLYAHARLNKPLLDAMNSVLKAAQKHNESLSSPGGTSRTAELRRAIEELKSCYSELKHRWASQ